MSFSKHKLAGKLSKKTLSLDEKVKFLDFDKGNPKFGCRKLAKKFKIGKTATANILKEEKSIRSQHELFREKSKKRNRPGKYQKINDICGNDLWYQRCFASNIYPNGPMLKEEVMAIKESLKHSSLDQFRASDGWLDT